MFEVLLINPPLVENSETYLNGDKFISESLALGYFKSYLYKQLPDKLNIKILDCYLDNLDVNNAFEIISDIKPDLLGFSISYHPATTYLENLLKLCDTNEINSFIVAGGNHATFNHNSLLIKNERLNAVIRGEGEIPFFELIKSLIYRNDSWKSIKGIAYTKSNIVIDNGFAELVINLDHLPLPARDTLSSVIDKGGTPYISASRGCYARCKFCTVNKFYDDLGFKWRGRTASNIAKEFISLQNEHNVH